jgi:O-antigen ligase
VTLFLGAIPLLLVVSLVFQGLPTLAHPVLYLAGLLWLGCLASTGRRIWRWTLPSVPVVIVLLTAILAVNAYMAGNEYGRLKVLNWLVTSLPLMLWPVLVRINKEHFTPIAWGQLLTGLVVLPMLITLDRRFYADTAYIFVALFAGLAVVSGWALPKLHRPFYYRPLVMWMARGLTLIALLGLIFSGARGALLAVVASCFVIPFVYGFRHLWRYIVAGIFLAGLLLAMPQVWESQVERLADVDMAESVGYRLLAWSEAFQAFLSSPLTGIGAGRFAELTRETGILIWPHNLLLELAAEFGIVALALMCYMLYVSLIALWRLRKESPAAAAFGLTSFIFLLVNAMKMGDISTHRLLYLWIGIAFAIRQTQPKRSFQSILFGRSAAR